MKHPNRREFSGILALLDKPSDGCPAGCRKHRIILSKEAVERCISTIYGMAVNFSPNFDNHDAQRKFGVITGAMIVDNRIEVSGFLYEHDFPEVVGKISAAEEEYGMSVELTEAAIQDITADCWFIKDMIFGGAAVLLKKKAAYKETNIRIHGYI